MVMYWIYVLSSDTKWDHLYMFKLEVSALLEGPMVTWDPNFGNLQRNNCFVKFRYEYVLLTN